MDHSEAAAGSRPPSRRREALRTTLWFVPSLLVLAAVAVFALTYVLDLAVYGGHLGLPSWAHTGSGDAARAVLIGIAAAVVTVAGVVFSITIVALTLASQQFGPRMLRNFTRDLGTQISLGVFIATSVYALLALGSITNGSRGEFVPHISVTVAEVLAVGSLCVLIYFIHHIAASIQLPQVIAGIARDLERAIDAEFPEPVGAAAAEGPLQVPEADDVAALAAHIRREGATVPATESGYLQWVGYGDLERIAERADAVILLAHRPGHFVVEGRSLATVWPPRSARVVSAALARAHATGPHRTLIQDPVFAIDQLVEIAIRALSPAVNDTFTALTCIDWLTAGCSRISGRRLSEGVYRDRGGEIRLIEAPASYARLINRSFDKIRQAGRGMPAVNLRQLESLGRIMESATGSARREVLLQQAAMILRSAEESVPEERDLALIRARHADVVGSTEQ